MAHCRSVPSFCPGTRSFPFPHAPAVGYTRYASLRSVNLPCTPSLRPFHRDWNLEGARAPGAQVFAVIFGAAKRSLSLSMILMVCMGYGVVRPSLGQDIHKIMGMALVYFVSSAVRAPGWKQLSC